MFKSASNTDECTVMGVVNGHGSRSVSKNGGGKVSGGKGWDGSTNRNKDYIEEPGSCSSYSWDVGLDNEIYKETKLYNDIKSEYSGGEGAQM